MKPYYQDKWVTIYHGDCREILPRLDKVDLVLADPPYNAANIGISRLTYEGQVMKLPEPEYIQFCQDWFNAALCASDRIAVTSGIANMWYYPKPKWVLCWHKPNSRSFNSFGSWNSWEPILVYGKPKGKLGQDYIRNDLSPKPKEYNLNHPCPKPQKVWDWLIGSLTSLADTILDPFLGSGTTCFCAKKLNRYSIGIEIEEKYCEIAAKRCCQEVMEFDP